MKLTRGEKRGLRELGVEGEFTVKVDFDLPGTDIAAFGLDGERRIGDDRYVVLFSNPRAPDDAVTLVAASDSAVFTVNADALPSSIDRIVFTATHDTRPVSDARPLVVTVGPGKAVFDVAEHLTAERAVMMIEIYRHSSGWRLGTIAAGFAGGLASLVQHFGGEVDALAAGAGTSPTPPSAPTAPPPAPAVSLKKITLEKSNSSVSLKKVGDSFGEIVLNLNWHQGTARRGLFGGAKNVDLDLGVLFELNDGSKGVVQALGNSFGGYEQLPWIELSGDDRTGAVSDGETIRVNGRYFDRIKRLAVFANIYDGVPNWAKTDGVVRMNIPGQPEIEVRLDEGRDNCRLCGIAVVDNVAGQLQIERHMQYYRDQKGFADAVGIRLRWKSGSKD
ncbi:TerD family protein [Sphingomonas sp. R86521]|uniref:TerD family protein n=1 Tax=Sphingomonas sp. R86521 TaxID=3093860 RepID=UPI0036D216D8